MENIVNADQIPAQAHRLYVQLYCERKGEKNKITIQEARKSWASLSIPKKKLFYKTTTDRNLRNYAHGLSKTKTYLKEKVPKHSDKILCMPQHSNEEHGKEIKQQEIDASINGSYLTENGSQLKEENEFINNETRNNTMSEDANESQVVNTGSPEPQSHVARLLFELSPSNCRNNTNLEEADETEQVNIGSLSSNPRLTNQDDEIEDALETQSNTSRVQRDVVPLAEPIPPTVKVGKNLYEFIKRPGNPEWKEISKKDKSHYNTAVRAIKREYIKNYTKYLESLSQQQLFDHYIKTLQ